MEITPLFSKQCTSFFNEFGTAKHMVLSTSLHDHVTSRMMSIIQLNGSFYFQTDQTFRKYGQLLKNRNVSLCTDNIQIEGISQELGRPMDFPHFITAYQKAFLHSFQLYSSLQNERLFQITPTFIERWIYKDGVPFIETFDFKTSQYKIQQYLSI